MPDRVMLVEDDARLIDLVSTFLTQRGFDVSVASRGDTAVEQIVAEQPDLVLLDLMLPGLDGMEVCRRVRRSYPGPIVMLSARNDEIDEIMGLQVGADAFLAKPIRPRVLLAHIQAQLRRARKGRSSEYLVRGRLMIDTGSRLAALEGVRLDLTTSEYDLLLYLAQRAGKVVDREALYEDVRGMPWDGRDRSIDLRVSRLRKKLGDEERPPAILKSVRGTGYLLVKDV